MDDDDRRISASASSGGSFWVGVALLIIYFWNGDGIMSLHAALVHYLMK